MENMPRFAKRETILIRHIKRFHQHMVSRMAKDHPDTMRATAWQIEEYLEEHGKYHDSEFIRQIQKSLEKIIQHKSGTKWTVKKAMTDLRGRTCGINQFAPKETKPRRAPVPRKLSQEITDRVLDIPRREFD